ncbi:MAG: aminotransferase class V-fold PLP-dependent enzyme [Verrucomicrobia bacterium]|nr:aminotransferase class V-fold PLP-dependent enzyme [Verrucomicrobiota bacterium]
MIYLDHNATTPVLPEVREAMLPYLEREWGNPSSTYRFGSKLKGAIEKAREQVADLVGAKSPREILFTSGGTESNNTAIHSAILSRPEKKHIITSQVEHSSVLSYCRHLEKHHGYQVTYLPVDREGLFALSDLEAAMSADTAIVSLMWANNETGVLFPVHEIGIRCHDRGIPFHCDAVQAAGKLPIDLKNAPIDYLSITGHKIGASKGCGALYVQRKTPFIPFIHGGHQEKGKRGGTESVALVVGLGVASEISQQKLPVYDSNVRPLRDALEHGIFGAFPDCELNGHKTLRLQNTSNIYFPGIAAEAMLLLLDQAGVCGSSGSACLADSPDPSHVIAAMKPGAAARNSVRWSLGLWNNPDEIAQVVRQILRITSTLRS